MCQLIGQHDFYCEAVMGDDNFGNLNGKGIDNKFERTIINNEKIVIDQATGLMWQQSGSITILNPESADEWINELNKKRFAGFEDWRLPTVEELFSLMRSRKNQSGIFIDSIFDDHQKWIWTCDKITDSQLRWSILFTTATCLGGTFEDCHCVRAVRSVTNTSIWHRKMSKKNMKSNIFPRFSTGKGVRFAQISSILAMLVSFATLYKVYFIEKKNFEITNRPWIIISEPWDIEYYDNAVHFTLNLYNRGPIPAINLRISQGVENSKKLLWSTNHVCSQIFPNSSIKLLLSLQADSIYVYSDNGKFDLNIVNYIKYDGLYGNDYVTEVYLIYQKEAINKYFNYLSLSRNPSSNIEEQLTIVKNDLVSVKALALGQLGEIK